MAAAILALMQPAAAASDGPGACTPPNHFDFPVVTVETQAAEAMHRFDLSRTELTELARHGGVTSRHNDGILGLTLSTIDLRTTATHHWGRTGDGRVCLWVTDIRAELGIPRLTVHVAADYEPGSCQFETILEHENEHVRRTRGLLIPFGERLEVLLETAVDRINPIVARSREEADALYRARLRDFLSPFMAELEAERDRLNAEIDQPANYRETIDRCPWW